MQVYYDVKRTMVTYGFNFLLKGTIYIYEMVLEITNNYNFYSGKDLMQRVAERHSVKFKTMNRTIRWAISNARKWGAKITTNMKTKDVIRALYDETSKTSKCLRFKYKPILE